jgi:serine/threonine protein kinase
MECLRDKIAEGIVLDGRFETVKPLNHGSFGMVSLARDLYTDELVAVKCLTKPSAIKSCPVGVSVDEFSQELQHHGILGSHPNIVNLIHAFETDAHIYLVLEYCSMGDLYEAIRVGRGPLQTEHVRAFMLQLVDAVDYMHLKGVYHRDIKPENIFLTQSGSMKLGDFGLATTDVWSHESCVGSDRYMAPEQYDASGVGYSPAKADIWAIGICLLNILFSRNPFAVPAESDPLFADYRLDKQTLFDVFPTMSQDTFEVLSNALALDPEKRSLETVREALDRVISFTTDDESLDDFCTEDREVVAASANREPLRTPSIQSPQVAQGGSFPWAQALHLSPVQQFRQLSAIPDNESYTEDLFPASEKAINDDWISCAPATPSVASVLDSGLGASFDALNLFKTTRARPENSISSGPAPIPMRSLPALSSVFGGRTEAFVSKSWSDLWDEDEEEERVEREREATLQKRREQNARSWSQESSDERTARVGGLHAPITSSTVNIEPKGDRSGLGATAGYGCGFDGVNESEGFFFEDEDLSGGVDETRVDGRGGGDVKLSHIHHGTASGDGDAWLAFTTLRGVWDYGGPYPAAFNQVGSGDGKVEDVEWVGGW